MILTSLVSLDVELAGEPPPSLFFRHRHLQDPCTSPHMASNVVPPLSVRVSAALAAARIVLFTLGKLLSILALVAVLDTCNAEALADMANSSSDFLFDTLFPTVFVHSNKLLHILFYFVQAHTPTFLHIDFYHVASQVWEEMEPCIPPPPIRFCILGKGIQCGSDLARRPTIEAISSLATRLVCHLVDSARSLGLSCITRSSTMFSNSLFWYYLLSFFACFVLFALSSLWMLYSAGRSLEDYPLEPFESINARLFRIINKLRSLWTRLRKHELHALVSMQCVYVFWPSGSLRILCSYEAELHGRYHPELGTAYCRKDLHYYLYERLVRSVLDSQVFRFALCAVAAFCFISAVAHGALFFYSVWVRLILLLDVFPVRLIGLSPSAARILCLEDSAI